MNEAENLKLSINQDTTSKKIRKVNLNQKWVRLDEVISWIDSLGHGDETKKELKKIVSKYPEGTYYKFKSDISKHIAKIQRERESKDE